MSSHLPFLFFDEWARSSYRVFVLSLFCSDCVAPHTPWHPSVVVVPLPARAPRRAVPWQRDNGQQYDFTIFQVFHGDVSSPGCSTVCCFSTSFRSVHWTIVGALCIEKSVYISWISTFIISSFLACFFQCSLDHLSFTLKILVLQARSAVRPSAPRREASAARPAAAVASPRRVVTTPRRVVRTIKAWNLCGVWGAKVS